MNRRALNLVSYRAAPQIALGVDGLDEPATNIDNLGLFILQFNATVWTYWVTFTFTELEPTQADSYSLSSKTRYRARAVTRERQQQYLLPPFCPSLRLL